MCALCFKIIQNGENEWEYRRSKIDHELIMVKVNNEYIEVHYTTLLLSMFDIFYNKMLKEFSQENVMVY